MLKARLAAASEVRDVLISAETAVDHALQEMASLLSTMCAARTAANLPLQIASTEFDHVAQAVSMIGQARAHMLTAHKAFVDTRTEILPTVSWGDVGECPPATAGHLREPVAPLMRAVG